MCTAISCNNLFGRNLDVSCDYGGETVIMPRGFPITPRHEKRFGSLYTVMGTACVQNGFPLFFDAFNERGLSAAGLNFIGNAFYKSAEKGKINLAHFEIIPYILGKCADMSEALDILNNMNITDDKFSPKLECASLHWLFSDGKKSVTVEQTRAGLRLYENPVGVLTNNPPFDCQLRGLVPFMNLTAKFPENRFSDKIKLSADSLGIGAYGLPGDYSSRSRFVKASFVKLNSDFESDAVSAFFHILSSVSMPKGAVRSEKNEYEFTDISVCFDTDEKICYCKTYGNSRITAVKMTDIGEIQRFPLLRENDILFRNR